MGVPDSNLKVVFCFLKKHLHNADNLLLKSIFTHSTSTVASASLPRETNMTRVPVGRSYLQIHPAAVYSNTSAAGIKSKTISNSTLLGEAHDANTERVWLSSKLCDAAGSGTQVPIQQHKLPSRIPSQKNRRVRSESCGHKDVFVEASASEGRWF